MKALIVTALAIFILLLPVLSTIFNFGFYAAEYERLGVYTRLDKADVDNASISLMRYFISGPLHSSYFNGREKAHLADVKGLIQGMILLFCLDVLLLLSLIPIHKKIIGEILVKASLLCLATLGIFSLLCIIDFDSLFLKFHLISFSNDYWLLNPATDRLIVMTPENFYRDAVAFIGIQEFLIALWVLMTGYILRISKKS